jgi:signal transduction histidine kinase/CheY-like chemotaxis protein
MESIDGRDFDHCETLLCVKSACSTAVEILNDLLCFDKLESGILELHKHEVPVIPFIADCVNMFASQAREAGVTITNTTGCAGSMSRRGPNHASSMLPTRTETETNLFNDDIVVMDKFKMDQVLRNLISNAIKFTPQGGYVTVCASFIPSETRDYECTQRQPSVTLSGVTQPRPVPVTGWAGLSLSALRARFSWPLRRRSRVHVSVNDIADDIEMGLDHRPETFAQGNAMRCSPDRNSAFNSVASRGSAGSGNYQGVSGEVRSRHMVPDISDISNSSAPSDAIDSLENLVAPTHTIAGKLRIVVTDTGAGISEADRKRLFKEIVQFDPEILQAGGGSGLGLWITSSIVQMHSGTIHAHSAGTNKGSTFTVEIDMYRRVPSGQPFKVPSHCSAAQSPGESMALDFSKALEYLEYGNSELTHKTAKSHPMLESKSFRQAAIDINSGHHLDVYDVLVVDDSGLNRKLLCKLLRASGHTCEEASDGRYAIDKVKARMARGAGGSSSYDVILMDFVMPNMDGPTTAEALRGLGYSGPIIGVSGNAQESNVNYFMACGADAVLSKPFDFQLFKALMTDFKLAYHQK